MKKDNKTLIMRLRNLGEFELGKMLEKPIAVLVLSFDKIEKTVMRGVARMLIDQSCKCVLCTGVDSNNWENTFDNVYVEKYHGNVPEEETFLTTIHDNESVKDVVDYLYTLTIYGKDRSSFNNFLVLIVGKNQETEKRYLDEIKNHSEVSGC